MSQLAPCPACVLRGIGMLLIALHGSSHSRFLPLPLVLPAAATADPYFQRPWPLGRPATAVGHQASAARVCGAAPRADGSGGREGQPVPA